MFFGKFGVRRSVTSGIQPNPPPTRLQSFISHPTSPCTGLLAGSAAAAADCAPPGCVHLELEKAWLFGRRSWPPPAPVCSQPPPRPVCGATLRRRCHRLRGCAPPATTQPRLSSPAAANRSQHAVVIGHIQAAGEGAVCRDAKTDCMCLFSSSVGFVVVFAA
jgi:hypothetical protein